MTSPLAAAAGITGARCGDHPGSPASPCRRCGRFACADCFGASPLCPACRMRALDTLAPTEGLARSSGRWITAEVVLGIIFFAVAALFPLEDQALTVQYLPGALYLVTFVGSRVQFLRWMHRLTRNCEELGAGFSRSARWAIGSFFVPLANLFVPYFHMSELATWVHFRNPARAGVGLWWTAWLLSSFVDGLSSRVGRSEHPELQRVSTAVMVVSAALTVVAAVTCIRMIRAMEAGFGERRDRLQAAPGPLASGTRSP